MRSSWLSTVSLFLLACGPGSVASEQGDTRDDATAQTATQATDSTNATHVETSPETNLFGENFFS